jgi:ribosomal protein S14
MKCPVCFDETAKELEPAAAGTIETECQRCGRFKYTAAAWDKLS